MEERVPTGVAGLDELMGGGLPRGRSILLSGTCGTGKTTLAIQFLHNGVLKYGENGILLTLEQNADEIRKDMLSIGVDLKKLETEGKLTIIDTSLSKFGIKDYMSPSELKEGSFTLRPGEFNIDNLLAVLTETARKMNAKRIVIDSLPALDYLLKDVQDVRRILIQINYQLKISGLTTIIITEGEDEDGLSKHGVEEYISDGVIVMRINEALDTRTIKIRKMRITKHSLKPTTFELTTSGVQIKAQKGL
ncbi:MAG: ATPase domain-containing protein [Candidatus Altiarchaeota archaeon]